MISLNELVGGGYRDYWYTDKRYVVCKGSRGSKKSKTTALWIIFNLVKHSGANVLCVRRYQSTIRDSQYSDLKWAVERLGLTAFFKFTVSPLEITKIDTGQKILFRGLDDGVKVTSISVPKGVLCWTWFEEAYEIAREDDFNKVDMSIRGTMPAGLQPRMMITFNPWSANSWLKKRFFDCPDENTFVKTTTWQCNEWLSEADKNLFLSMKNNNPRRYHIEGDGEWGIADGLIYENVELQEFNIEEVKRIKGIKACYGLDFGYTDPNAFVASLVDTNTSTIYVFDEWYQTNTTNRQISQAIIRLGYGSERIICDCAEPKSIKELCEDGIRAEPSRKGADSVNHGIQLIQNYKILVHPRCKEFYKEVTNYCWSKDRNNQPTDRPDHEFSHGMDAFRYAITKSILPNKFSFN